MRKGSATLITITRLKTYKFLLPREVMKVIHAISKQVAVICLLSLPDSVLGCKMGILEGKHVVLPLMSPIFWLPSWKAKNKPSPRCTVTMGPSPSLRASQIPARSHQVPVHLVRRDVQSTPERIVPAVKRRKLPRLSDLNRREQPLLAMLAPVRTPFRKPAQPLPPLLQ